jgi:hypothetical protein
MRANKERISISYKGFIGQSRVHLLELLEGCYGHTEQWPIVRKRILAIFGKDGFGKFLTPNNEGSRK